MRQKETIAQFHTRRGGEKPTLASILVNRLENYCRPAPSPYGRRDFYKIMLFEKADGMLSYADKTIPITDNALLFTNAMAPYSWEGNAESAKGYICVFTEAFITPQFKTESIAGAPLFKKGGHPVLYPDLDVFRQLAAVFEQMLAEVDSGYKNKQDLLRSFIQIIVHTSLKISPPEKLYIKGTSFARISNLFLELLDRQFPIWSPNEALLLKNANEFASRLGIHTNHLNKALREHTGKTTTEHIAEYVKKEAVAQLLHSDWTMAEITQSLGFNHTSNFITFFKKQTGQTPHQFRAQIDSIS